MSETAPPADDELTPVDLEQVVGEVEPEQDPHGWLDSLVHPSRRGWVLIASALTTIILLGIALLLPVPFVKLAPGPTYNVIGEVDGQPVIRISGTQTYPSTGSLDMTTVLEAGGPRGGLTFVNAIAAWLNPSDAVVPRELIFPDDVSGEEVARHNALMFSTSESNAVAAAMTYLGRPVLTTTVVTAVFSDSPSDGLMLPKDEITSIDGTSVTEPQDIVTAVRSAPIGTSFDIGIRRDGAEVDGALQDNVDQTITVTSAANPDDATVPYIGIGVGTFYAAEFPIDFTLQDVGGPSAGTMFATGIVDLLTPGDLTAGGHVAGTGTIEPDGSVGAIGGIRQKLAGARNAGATLFLMPKVHCKEVEGHIPDGLTVVPVETLAEGVDAIKAFTAGEPVASCPAPVS